MGELTLKNVGKFQWTAVFGHSLRLIRHLFKVGSSLKLYVLVGVLLAQFSALAEEIHFSENITPTPCENFVSDSSDSQLFKLIKRWMENGQVSVEQRAKFIHNLKATPSPVNPFEGYTDVISNQLARVIDAKSLHTKLTQEQWQSMLKKIDQLEKKESKVREKIEEIDEEEAKVTGLVVEGELVDDRLKVVKPKWITTPSGKNYVLVKNMMFQNFIEVLKEMFFYEYDSESGHFQLLKNLEVQTLWEKVGYSRFQSGLKIEVVENALDDDRLLVVLAHDPPNQRVVQPDGSIEEIPVPSDYHIAELTLSTGEIKVLDRISGWGSQLLVHEGSVYYANVDSIENSEYKEITFIKIDLESGEKKTIYEGTVNGNYLTVSEPIVDSGKVLWLVDRLPEGGTGFLFHTSTEKLQMIEHPFGDMGEYSSVVKFPTEPGKNLILAPDDTTFRLFEYDEMTSKYKKVFESEFFSTTLSSVEFIKSEDGVYYILANNMNRGGERFLFKLDLNQNKFDKIGKMADKSRNTRSPRLYLNKDNRLYLVQLMEKGQYSAFEFLFEGGFFVEVNQMEFDGDKSFYFSRKSPQGKVSIVIKDKDGKLKVVTFDD